MVLSDGSVACWGRNEFGECDVPDGVGTPANPVVSLAFSTKYLYQDEGGHSVALLADGSIACWGRNDKGQCDVPRGIGTPENPVVQVAVGGWHTVALLADGSIRCWGDNDYGQCDVPSGIGTPGNPVASIAAGGWGEGGYTVAILADTTVVCWGDNRWGQCTVPDGLDEEEEIPTPIAVSAGGRHTVALVTDGSVVCWGYDDLCECSFADGIGTPDRPITRVAAGHSVTVALIADRCPADFDRDGLVGGSDLGLLLIAWGDCGDCPADLDGDGAVGGSDLGLLFVDWGECP